MKLEDVRKEIYYFSEKASGASQKLALAGIGVIWLFKSTDGDIQSFHPLLYWSLLFFIITLFIEFVHYLVFAPVWAKYYVKKYAEIKKNKKDNIEETEVVQPTLENKFGWWLYAIKAITLLAGYTLFMIYFCSVIQIEK